MKFNITRVICFGLLAAIGAQAADKNTPVARGRDTFMRVGCYECHGTVGQGGSAGLKLAPEPLPVEALTQFLRGTTGAMPAYSEKVLSDAQVADIHAYLASIPAPPPIDKIPLLRDLRQGS